jgi:hypothetical protein
MAKKDRYKGITRIDQPEKHTHGWYVRIRFNKEVCAKFFSDDKHRGKVRALMEAVDYRDEMEKQLGKPRTDRIVVTASSRNQTGMVGICRRKTKTKLANGKVQYHNFYVVTWSPEPNHIARTSVSIDLYGEEEAFQRACRIRQEKELAIYGRVLRPQPTKTNGKAARKPGEKMIWRVGAGKSETAPRAKRAGRPKRKAV